MKILHYFLGFPPYRTGGLTKYCMDLMEAQADRGDVVLAMWPGEITSYGGTVQIRQRGQSGFIHSYEVINPLPVSLDEGIIEVDAFMASCKTSIFMDFLKKELPDVIHIHTLMGLYKEFIDAAKTLKIRTVFTTHDYFGICPKVTLYKPGTVCDNDHACADCVACNKNALSLKTIKMMQSPMYRKLKDSSLVKALRKKHRTSFFEEEGQDLTEDNETPCLEEIKKYQKLRKFYVDILSQIDVLHCNSSVAENVYKKYTNLESCRVVSITHKGIEDHRQHSVKAADVLRITYLAPTKPFKGYFVLRKALDELWEAGDHRFEVKIFAPVANPAPYMVLQEDGFKYNELAHIFENTDVLVAPSVWYETFGFTVLEALSYGIPVIVSDHVGAKDVVGEGGIVIPAGSVEAFKEAILGLTNSKLMHMKECIRTKMTLKSWEEFLEENDALYFADL